MANGSPGRYCTNALDDEKRGPAGAGAHATLMSECRVAPPGSDSCGGSVVGMEHDLRTVADMQARSLKR